MMQTHCKVILICAVLLANVVFAYSRWVSAFYWHTSVIYFNKNYNFLGKF